ncbi:MAG: cell division protein FtsZ [Candidatus Heimdallarchaeota archaeon]|nr:MAG: cell division protein FtsZ [Candidatus Heimdallarchaeota archaeon]
MESILKDALNGTGSFKNLGEPKTEPVSLYSSQTPKIDNEIADILTERLPRVQVVGVGGAGNNAVYRLMSTGVDAECIAVNTDAQHLLSTRAHKKLLIGKDTSRGFGAGNNPEIGETAARESLEDIKTMIIHANMVFVTCGLGGGTGTGAAHVIAKQAREKGALTVSICTLPFQMEGVKRYENARNGLKKLYEASDTVIVVPNEKLLQISDDITMMAAFRIADEVLLRSVKAITELITKPQLINLDFADVRKILTEGGMAMIGLGESDHQHMKVDEAVFEALRNPLLDDLDISSAKKGLICVSGGEGLALKDAEEAVMKIAAEIDNSAEIIWGATIDPELGSKIRVIVVLSDVHSPLTETDGLYYSPSDLESLLSDLDSPFSVISTQKTQIADTNKGFPTARFIVEDETNTEDPKKGRKKFLGLF